MTGLVVLLDMLFENDQYSSKTDYIRENEVVNRFNITVIYDTLI